MKWFNNLKIQKKLFLAFGILISMMIILIAYSASQNIKVNRMFGNLTGPATKRLTSLADAIETLTLLRLNNISTSYQIYDNEISLSLFSPGSSYYENTCESFLECIRNYRESTSSDTLLTGELKQTRLDYIDTIENLFTGQFKPCFYEIRDGVDNGNNYQTGKSLNAANTAANQINVLLITLRDTAVAYIENETKKTMTYSQRIIYTQFFVAAGILIFSVFASVLMAKRLEKPIYMLESAATEIAAGNLSYPIRIGWNDELGSLSNRIGDMVDSMKKTNQAKSDFLANMSHEMRTPLNVVVGLTNLRLEDPNLGSEIKKDLEKINRAGEILLALVNDVLDISKIEAGKLELTQVDYSTANLLNDIITLNMIRTHSKPVDFIIDLSEYLPSELHGDELRVKEIFNNLLSNAFKYTREGSVTLRVAPGRRDGNHIWISVTVSDTGIGIRKEDTKRLFSDYNQVDAKANRRIEGTGLGLAISKKLVELMDGDISVESEYGKGSSFKFNFRQTSLNDKTLGRDTAESLRYFRYADQKQHASANLVRPDLSYARVLVVDDYPTNLDVAAGMLRKYKMQVNCVSSGQAALDLIRAGEPVYDAVFMDHMMPEMDGMEATQLIRSLDSEYARTVPIISLTANALAGNEQMFLEKGFNGFLSKPINILKLDAIVKKWIGKKLQEPFASQEAYQRYETQEPIISGVNTEAGLELYGGDMDIFLFALESFVANTIVEMNNIQNVTQETLQEYAIAVHGLKSTSAAIGAEEASEKARKLETMAKAGDLQGVLAENSELLKVVGILVNDIRNWLQRSKNTDAG